jgi:hypothetical protein
MASLQFLGATGTVTGSKYLFASIIERVQLSLRLAKGFAPQKGVRHLTSIMVGVQLNLGLQSGLQSGAGA